MQKKGSDPDTRNQQWARLLSWSTFFHLVFLALIVWIAHYFYYRSLGLYEDDFAHISFPLGWHLGDLVQYLRAAAAGWPQGRPLGFFLLRFFAFAGKKLYGLSGIYIIAYLIQISNAWLFYLLLRRIETERIALLGALTLSLFPADTTHTFLSHALNLHISITFLLLASHLYMSKHYLPSYLFALASLVTYESPYLVFLAIPILGKRWDRRLGREMLRHAAVWISILIVVVLIRSVLGEGRVMAAEAGLGTVLLHSLVALGIGPVISLSSFIYGPGWTILHWNSQLTLVFAACLLPFVLLLVQANHTSAQTTDSNPIHLHAILFGRPRRIDFTVADPEILRLMATGGVMLILAYGFSFTHFPPTALYGRMTSVHLAAAFGGSIIFACLCSLGLEYARSHRLGLVLSILLAVYLSGLTAYCFSIQLDFKQAWKNERSFWTQATAELPDLTDGTIVFVLNHDLPMTRFILTNSWADPTILYQIYTFPADWQTPPRLFVVGSNWTETVVRTGDQLEWQIPAATWPAHWETLPNGNVILLEMENGRLVRRFGSLMIDGEELRLKPLPATVSPDWPEGTLYPYLLGSNN